MATPGAIARRMPGERRQRLTDSAVARGEARLGSDELDTRPGTQAARYQARTGLRVTQGRVRGRCRKPPSDGLPLDKHDLLSAAFGRPPAPEHCAGTARRHGPCGMVRVIDANGQKRQEVPLFDILPLRRMVPPFLYRRAGKRYTRAWRSNAFCNMSAPSRPSGSRTSARKRSQPSLKGRSLITRRHGRDRPSGLRPAAPTRWLEPRALGMTPGPRSGFSSSLWLVIEKSGCGRRANASPSSLVGFARSLSPSDSTRRRLDWRARDPRRNTRLPTAPRGSGRASCGA